MALAPIFIVILGALGLAVAILLAIFVLGPIFRLIGWLITHVFEYIGGTIGDTVRLVGSILAMIVLAPLAPLNVVIGRWSAATHFAGSVKRECKVGMLCLYRIAIQRPLKLVMLGALLEGIEQRVPEAVAASPGSDKPSRRGAEFEGYRIVGSLPGGGSGGKLYVAQPDANKIRKIAHMPDRVVIKWFALSEGSSLPQIVRESRALEAARQLGLVLDHVMDEEQFYYVMPFHDGDHLGIITRQMHAESGADGLKKPQLAKVASYMHDLLGTLTNYHRGGLWHKDVKPENIIIHDGKAHIVDLGLVTQLRSAMTLTTHGTEYFRDPEMVRQALRGVKVHQIDCSKFDIYAAGAVLYFMLENTFPAHGGLSRFGQKSPEALRWIIRRSMAEYNQRYADVDAMLEDLRVVMQASDPFAVTPAQLPSMGGQTVPPPVPPTPHQQTIADAAAAAGAAVASVVSAVGATFAPDHEDVEASVGERAGSPIPPPVDAPAQEPRGIRRPRLNVLNWWTGSYAVADKGDVVNNDAAEQEAARQWRHDAQAASSPTRSAKDQRKSAKARVANMRRRAHERRQRFGTDRRPTAGLVFLCLLFVGVVFAGGLIISSVRRSSYEPAHPQPQADLAVNASQEITVVGDTTDLPLLLINAHPEADTADVQRDIRRTIDSYTRKGYFVVTDITGQTAPVVETFRSLIETGGDKAVYAFEDALAAANIFGVLHGHQDRFGNDGLSWDLITSARADARDRRFVPEETLAIVGDDVPWPADSRARVLVINDHPLKADSDVKSGVALVLNSWTDKGWDIIEDDAELEAAARRHLPTAGLPMDDAQRTRLSEQFLDEDIVIVLRVLVAQGDGPAERRIAVEQFQLN